MVEFYLVGQCSRVLQLSIRRRKRRVVNERDGMRLRQVRSKIARAGGHGCDTVLHFYRGGAAVHQTQCDGAIVAA